MNLFKHLLPLVVAVGFTSTTLYAAASAGGHLTRHDEELNERDLQSLRQFVNSKRTIDTQEKSTNLTISGDMRTEWRHMNEKYHGVKILGGDIVDENGVRLSHNDFDIEFNLRFDYVCDRAWAVAHVEFDNPAGIDNNDCFCDVVSENSFSSFSDLVAEDNNDVFVSSDQRLFDRFHGSGRGNNLDLQRCYVGYNVFADCGRLDVELGRRPLYDIFESEIQFLSQFDGLFIKYSDSWECVADWYVSAGGFVVDERTNHFSYVTEIAFLNICDYGFDVKYSFIDWTKRGKDRCFTRDPRGFKFRNSQVIVTYHLDPEWLCMPAEVYGAALVNHAGNRGSYGSSSDVDYSGRRNRKDKNWAWYVGITFGQVVREGDWSIDIEYQWVQENAIAFDDQSGIGIGNYLSDVCGFFATRGYRGWRIDALYAITDNLSLQAIVEASRNLGRRDGGRHTYSKFELEAIYAF